MIKKKDLQRKISDLQDDADLVNFRINKVVSIISSLCDYLGVEIVQPNQEYSVVKKKKGGK